MSRRKKTPATPAPYQDDAELLADLLALLTARVSVLMSARRNSTVADPALNGLVITEAEISELVDSDLLAESAVQFDIGSLWRQVEPRLAGAAELRWLQLRDRFSLSTFEMEVLLACLAPEVHRGFERIYGFLNDNIAQRFPTSDLLLRLLVPQNTRGQLQSIFATDSRLLRLGLLVGHTEQAGARVIFRVPDGVVRFLLGQGGIDSILARCWCPTAHSPFSESLWSRLPSQGQLTAALGKHRDDAARRALLGDAPLVVVVRGRPASGRRYLVESACAELGCGCISLDARLLKRSTELERTLVAAFRDSAIARAPVLLHSIDCWYDDTERFDELRALVERLSYELGWALFITAQDAAPLGRWCSRARVLELPVPDYTLTESVAAWNFLLKERTPLAGQDCQTVAQALAARFRLVGGEIAESVYRAVGALAEPETAEGWLQLLTQHAAQVASPKLKTLAHRIPTTHVLDDLVLTPDKKDLLLDLIRRTRYRARVMEDWGFNAASARGRGLVALFFGPSGTGKTMAAEVIADQLGKDLYRVDLAGVVSKYIGETEKNLRAIFDEADRSDALLFFDEADALFGKRSEVRDAHDRYANIEINYLLQRIENFSGIAVLATNMRQHLDEAFLRRIHVSIEFPIPRAAERLEIWQRSFPKSAPLTDDVDLNFFASRFEIAGGNIRNIALGAAFLAAESGTGIGMPHLVAAAQREFVKSGRRVQPEEFAPHAPHTTPAFRKQNGKHPGAGHGMSPG